MEKPVNVLRLPFPFIRNPYLPGTALRLDRFQRQFTIVCTGVLSLPQDEPHVGFYSVSGEYVVGYCGLLEEAIALCESRFYELHAYPKLGAVASFDPRTVEVYDTLTKVYRRKPMACASDDARRVLSGVIQASEIVWRRPCRTAAEVWAVGQRMAALYEQAHQDMSQEAFESARRARREAMELRGFLISPRWRGFALQALDNTGVTCCNA
ncbi:hypothetical protein [Pseudomonas asplenii]|uniref:Uncharacterized protein n=1 Tax=Pseudomonas asplenii TaxID=53407 RepID=A0A0N0VIA8_9PSED|nr:hypothetical protein [Pseudomonas fuscovaginae]KPA87243.1 hypothetical protein PF66_06248 [Pseudomonas fuscovaginae]KPA98209.1 hypothetical protein PF70_01606 [Pseudomonas fuscovaginae]